MKKIICFLAVASTMLMASCGSDDSTSTTTPPVGGDDNGGTNPGVTSIILTADATTKAAGETFTFTVKNNLGATVTSSSTYTVDGVAIVGNTFTPTDADTYIVVATNGTLVSAPLTLTVTAAPVVGDNFFGTTAGNFDIDETRLYAQTNAANEILVYDNIIEGKLMSIFEVVAFTTGDEIFSIMIAVEQDMEGEGINTPKIAMDSNGAFQQAPLGAYVVLPDAEAPVEASDDALYSYNFLTAATTTAPGQMTFGLEDTVVNASFEGDYKGIYALPVTSQGRGINKTKTNYKSVLAKSVKVIK